mmetsp:Transcript_5373/g.8213  ORF Transcript_5373/g.8213 Transcript_5373/m.8213 type:complete len:379 (-) Transcript_5373:227-1363(-)|eukprot:CAMPEP_0185024450 /NCGR_PEP_ID=MMETSP1103-20130426/7531_1 /TAXON_ID=36769 /ORGANISM="Paraphysomonas bandaiensis, Strain Caron Lab Isolate" /LENGTH=378 /DNA_ID=CAMNT_0027557423 /DNA_START=56 /DNA_END=1192 /DNA_ORIENTATION=+
MPKLLSVSILHRHGSRGPGASELTPWPDDHPVKSQWKENERENLSSVGHMQCELLGEWYVDRYIRCGAVDAERSRIFWRCSKSDRAKESGDDFIVGFNRAMGGQVVGPNPSFYPVDADNYFRPWKVFKDKADTIKNRQNTEESWKVKTEENKDFLIDVFRTVGASDTILSKLQKALWATTYLHAARECELYWPVEESERLELSKIFPPEHERRVTELALWVWEQRFLHSGFTTEMGGRMAVDILEHVLNLEHSVNIFSGHDYTLLGALCVLGVVKDFRVAMSFSAYILFELWDSSPEGDGSGGPVVRVILNPTPFKSSDGTASRTVQTWQEVVLKEFSLQELSRLLTDLRARCEDMPMKALKDESKKKEKETEIDMLS